LNPVSVVTLFVIGFATGVTSGVLGIGGGIVLAPMLLYLPPLVGLPPIDMKVVGGLTMVQSLASSLSAARVHHRFKFVHRGLVLGLGIPVAVTSFLGAWLSDRVESRVLLALFALMAVLAAVVMFVPKPSADREVSLGDTVVNRPLAAACGAVLGALGGLVGQTGSFLLVPVMIYVLGISTRVTLGSSLGIVLCTAVAGTAGKLLAGHVEASLAIPLIPGSLVGAYFGGHLSRRIPAGRLRYGVGLVSAAAAARVVYGLL
jgi:uncharacterized protein